VPFNTYAPKACFVYLSSWVWKRYWNKWFQGS